MQFRHLAQETNAEIIAKIGSTLLLSNKNVAITQKDFQADHLMHEI
jgi:hypothetical protein